MGRDLGPVTAGLTRNFALAVLRLDATAYVQLVGAADNAPGAGAEAVYVDSLVVPAGAVLDLNGKHIYARTAQIDGVGSIRNGSVSFLPANGPLTLNTPASGTISAVNEIDDYTITGRAGQSVVVAVTLASGTGTPPPIDPRLPSVDLQLLDPTGRLVTNGEATGSDATVRTLVLTLPADGSYHVRVMAPAQSGQTGNYLVAVYDARTIDRAMTLDQPTTGALSSPFATDRWTFSVPAKQQVRLSVAAAVPGVQFQLVGPDGPLGSAGGTDPVTLPSTGTYSLLVATTAFGISGYTFSLTRMTPTALTLSQAFSGPMAGPDGRPQARLDRRRRLAGGGRQPPGPDRADLR